jgi:lipoprotein-releasing system ATP-binding protein
MSKAPALSIRGLERRYKSGAEEIVVLHELDLDLYPGEIVGLVGPSGSGKSSLLHAAGLLERPTAGEVTIDGVAAWGLNDDARTTLRRRTIGFVYQFHHLLAEFDALDNVALPQLVAGKRQRAAREEARRLLAMLGLSAREHHQPAQLSGGEQQRVAIARAFANSPKVLLADEPTGNLDPHTAQAVFNSFFATARKEGVAALIATHNYDLAKHMDRVLAITEGHVEERRLAAGNRQ